MNANQSGDTVEATIYHRKFKGDDGGRHEVGADLGMGYDFAVDERGIDPSDPDVVDDAYVEAGTVEVDVKPGVDAPEAAVYSAWEDGKGHDPGSTRSMAVGDVIVIDGVGDDFGFFVDSIGFEEIDMSAFGSDDRDEDADGDDDRDPRTPSDAEVAEAFGVDDVDDITDEMLEDVDTPEPPECPDVSGYKTAAGAAKKTHEALSEWAEFLGHNADAVVLKRPEDEYQGYDAWAVVWEGGPYEWATALTGGTTLTGFAGPRMNYDGTPEVSGLTSGAGFAVECHFSFDLVFFDR
jgi:hypothetical protein